MLGARSRYSNKGSEHDNMSEKSKKPSEAAISKRSIQPTAIAISAIDKSEHPSDHETKTSPKSPKITSEPTSTKVGREHTRRNFRNRDSHRDMPGRVNQVEINRIQNLIKDLEHELTALK